MFACFGLTGFLALHLTCIARHEAFRLQSRFVFGVNLYEGAGYGKTKSLGLTFETAAVEVDFNVVFFSNIQFCKRLLNYILKN